MNRLRNLIGKSKLAARMMRAGFEKVGEPCPYCHRPGSYLGRGIERICLNCTYGWLYPGTRERFGWGAPQEIEFEGRYQP